VDDPQWDASGPQLGTDVWEDARMHLGSSSSRLHGDNVLPWRRHLALWAALKYFKYHHEAVCVPRAALCLLVWEPPFWLGAAG